VIPADPLTRFLTLLIEDYADEWLWRPAMHYRWSHDHDRALISRVLADELMDHSALPRWLKCRLLAYRQYNGFVRNDGVNPTTRGHVEQGYHRALAAMETLLGDRPFLFGDTPCIADFGLMGPMFRHFGQDPTPAQVMRETAPRVFAWVARMWNYAEGAPPDPAYTWSVDEHAGALLQEIAETHLVQLRENAAAYGDGKTHFSMTVQDCHYAKLPVSRYRVHCLEKLREHIAGLTSQELAQVRAALPHEDAAVLWSAVPRAESGYDPEGLAPFNRGINVLPPSRREGRF
jgi:glutathione S-transferase